MSILLASDNALQRYKTKQILKHLGFTDIWVIESASDLFSHVKSQPIDLLIIGRYLAEGESERAVEQLRASPEGASVPVLMITGPITQDVLLEIIDSGVDDVLLYPCTAEDLERRLHNIPRVPS